MDPISNYQQATARLNSATNDIERQVKIVRNGAAALSDWRKTVIANVDTRLPPEVVSNPHSTINGHDWPSAQKIADAIQQYHSAKLALDSAYEAIPETQRAVVTKPDGYL